MEISDRLRSVVRAALLARSPVDERERASIDRFLLDLERLAHPFDEHANPVHVTGSAIVLGPRGVLLLRHRRLGIWLQPGGHLDAGETPWDAALRESAEETGLDVRFASTSATASTTTSTTTSTTASTPTSTTASTTASTGTSISTSTTASMGPALVHVDVHPGGRGHIHLDLRYLVDGGDADPVPPADESQEIGWIAWPDAIALADDGLRGALVALQPR
jgi:8-oxo-dGTP pyrophosphatase MutT (NUDIX family)